MGLLAQKPCPPIMVAIFSKEIIEIAYGPQYISAPTFLSLHIILYLLVGLGYQVQKSFFNGIGETFTTSKIGLITLLLFILLGPFSTMYFSVPGLVIAILASNLIATIYGAYRAKTKFRIEFRHKNLLPIYSAAIVSAATALLTVRATSFSSLPKVTIGGPIYLLCHVTLLPVTRAITKRELEEAENATAKMPFAKPLISILLKYEHNIAARLEAHSPNPKELLSHKLHYVHTFQPMKKIIGMSPKQMKGDSDNRTYTNGPPINA